MVKVVKWYNTLIEHRAYDPAAVEEKEAGVELTAGAGQTERKLLTRKRQLRRQRQNRHRQRPRKRRNHLELQHLVRPVARSGAASLKRFIENKKGEPAGFAFLVQS